MLIWIADGPEPSHTRDMVTEYTHIMYRLSRWMSYINRNHCDLASGYFTRA